MAKPRTGMILSKRFVSDWADAFEDHHAHRDGPEDVDGYVTLRKIYWLIAHNIFRLKVNLIQDKYNQ